MSGCRTAHPTNRFLIQFPLAGRYVPPSFSKSERNDWKGGVDLDMLVLGFSFIKLDMLRCYDSSSSELRFPEDEHDIPSSPWLYPVI